VRVDRIEVASARVSEGELAAVANIIDWAADQGSPGGWRCSASSTGARAWTGSARPAGQVINLLAKGSEKHCRRQLGKTLEEHLSDVRREIDLALGQGLAVNLYLEDWSNGYRDSPDYVYAMVEGPGGVGHRPLHAAPTPSG
jgi:(R)-citramalate synthase